MLPDPQNLVGTWRRFGLIGPVHEIIGIGEELADQDRIMRALAVKTGEGLNYRFTEILDDPRER